MNRKSDMPLPLYHQIYLVLREQLLDSSFEEDGAMPSEVTLAKLYGVSRVTIRTTLDKLQKEGLISREKGRGTFSTPQRVSKAAPTDLQGFMNTLADQRRRTTTKVLKFAHVEPPRHVARLLRIEDGDTVLLAVRLGSYRGEVFSYVTTYLLDSIGRTITKAELRGPVLPLFERAGVKLARAEQTVTAKLADATTAKLLEVPIGAALISMRRTIYDHRHKPIEVNEGLYRPDRFEFQLWMERKNGKSNAEWAPTQRSSLVPA